MALALPFFATLSFATSAEDPTKQEGHLKALGEQGDDHGHIEVRESPWPSPEEFYTHYCEVDHGPGIPRGKPVLFRGLANSMPAMKKWATDENLRKYYSSVPVESPENNLKETRAGGYADHIDSLGKFLDEYNNTDIHLVTRIAQSLAKDISYPSFMSCGGFLSFLSKSLFWMANGSTKSVVHYDSTDNLNCITSGSKVWTLFHPRWNEAFQAHPNSPKNGFGLVDKRSDPTVEGYGNFFKIDVDRINLTSTPKWAGVDSWRAEMHAGDCLYLPAQWHHQVNAVGGMRTINFLTWFWRPDRFDKVSCRRMHERYGAKLPEFRYSDCTYGYDPGPGKNYGTKSNKEGMTHQNSLTRCELRPDRNIFAEVDVDRNMVLSESEIRAHFIKKGYEDIPNGFWAKEDQNGDGAIDWNECSGPKGAKKTEL